MKSIERTHDYRVSIRAAGFSAAPSGIAGYIVELNGVLRVGFFPSLPGLGAAEASDLGLAYLSESDPSAVYEAAEYLELIRYLVLPSATSPGRLVSSVQLVIEDVPEDFFVSTLLVTPSEYLQAQSDLAALLAVQVYNDEPRRGSLTDLEVIALLDRLLVPGVLREGDGEYLGHAPR